MKWGSTRLDNFYTIHRRTNWSIYTYSSTQHRKQSINSTQNKIQINTNPCKKTPIQPHEIVITHISVFETLIKGRNLSQTHTKIKMKEMTQSIKKHQHTTQE